MAVDIPAASYCRALHNFFFYLLLSSLTGDIEEMLSLVVSSLFCNDHEKYNQHFNSKLGSSIDTTRYEKLTFIG